MTTLTKLSYARGVANILQAQGRLHMPNTDALNRLSDKVASALDNVLPEPLGGTVPRDALLKLANAMIATEKNVAAQGVKLAADGRNVQHVEWGTAIGDLLESYTSKLAAELSSELGSSVGTPNADAPNDLANAAAHDVNAAIDNARRPEGYAEGELGIAGFSEPQSARTGMEAPHPGQDLTRPGAATNSVMESSKAAQAANLRNMQQVLKRANELGSTVGSPSADVPNQQPVDPAGIQYDQMRPPNYAHGDLGVANQPAPPAAEVGAEMAHPGQENHDGAGANSVTKLSQQQRKQAVASVMAALPRDMPTRDKMAAAVDLIDMKDPDAQELYLNDLIMKYS
jgi:hypothetical protein